MGRGESTSRRRKRDRRSEGEDSDSVSGSPLDGRISSHKWEESHSHSRRRKRKSSSRSRRKQSDDEESDSGSDSSPGDRRRSRRNRRSEVSSDSESKERRSRNKKREITEEEIIEYMAKKSQEKALKVAKKLKSQVVSGYSNNSNPFGDSNLGEKFVWRKKIERDVVRGRPLDISVKAEKKRQKESMARLKEIHADLLRKHLQRLEQPVETEQGLETEKQIEIEEDVMHDVDDVRPISPELGKDEPVDEPEEEPGSFSPQLLHADEDEEAIDPEADEAELKRKREAVLVEHQRRIQEAMAAKAAVPDELELKAMKVMGTMEEGDTVFGSGAEVNLDSQVYWWHDKYRPRKPKYFNRVHTGYEWNKYNQTHYDHDNPPPKIVHGYKFNIFYPDLVDKSKAPTYTIEKDGNGETCIIRFHAGPPYEDITFRTVNKEWEYSHKKGFKCTFERGILHVYFNFKRHRYRR